MPSSLSNLSTVSKELAEEGGECDEDMLLLLLLLPLPLSTAESDI